MRTLRLALVSLLAIIFLATTASADDASLGRVGENVQPIFNTRVEMLAEDVRVKVTPERSFVEAVFIFRNNGPAATVLVGFPEEEILDGREGFGDDTELHDFKAFIDGKEVPVQKKKGLVPEINPRSIDYPSWYTWEVEFAEGQIRELRNTYWVKNLYWSNGEVLAGYILTTGSTWEGSIGHARVTFEMQDILPYRLRAIIPGNYRFEGHNLVWEWWDFDPDTNIEVIFDNRGLLPFVQQALPPEAADQWWQKITAGKYLEVLQEIGDLKGKGSNPELEQALAIYEAWANQGLGRHEESTAAWERILEMAVNPGEIYLLSALAQEEAFYHLAEDYHRAGEQEKLEKLYLQLRALRLNAHLHRWVETLLPPEKLRTEPPLINKLEFLAGPSESNVYYLSVDIEDPDGDIVSFYYNLWYEEGGEKKEITFERPHFWYNPYHISTSYMVQGVPADKNVYYYVEVMDTAGNIASATGNLQEGRHKKDAKEEMTSGSEEALPGPFPDMHPWKLSAVFSWLAGTLSAAVLALLLLRHIIAIKRKRKQQIL